MIFQNSEHKAAPQKYQIYWDFFTTPQERQTRLTDDNGHVTGVVHSNTNRQSVITFICHRKLCSARVLQNPRLPVLQKVKLLFYQLLLSCDQPSPALQPATAETPARDYPLKFVRLANARKIRVFHRFVTSRVSVHVKSHILMFNFNWWPHINHLIILSLTKFWDCQVNNEKQTSGTWFTTHTSCSSKTYNLEACSVLGCLKKSPFHCILGLTYLYLFLYVFRERKCTFVQIQHKIKSTNGIEILPDPPAWQECQLLWKLLKLPEPDPCKHGHKQVKINMTVHCKVYKKEEYNLWGSTDCSDIHTKGRSLPWFLPLTNPQQSWGNNDAVSQYSLCSTAP